MSDRIRRPQYLINVEDNVSDMLSTILVKDSLDDNCYKLDKLRECYVQDRERFMIIRDELGLRGYQVETKIPTNLFHDIHVESQEVIFCDSNEKNFLKISFEQYGLPRFKERFNIESDRFFNYIPIEQFTCLNANTDIKGLRNAFEINGFKFININEIKEYSQPTQPNNFNSDKTGHDVSSSTCKEEFIVIDVEDMMGKRTSLQLPVSFAYPDHLKNTDINLLFSEGKFNSIRRYCQSNQITNLYQLNKLSLIDFLDFPGVGVGKFDQLINFLMKQCSTGHQNLVNHPVKSEVIYIGDELIQDVFAERTYLHFRTFCEQYEKKFISDLDSSFLGLYSQQKGVGKAKFDKIMAVLKTYVIDDINEYLEKVLMIKGEYDFLLELEIDEVFKIFSMGECKKTTTKFKDINGKKLIDLKKTFDVFKLIKLMDKLETIKSLNSIVTGVCDILNDREFEFLLLRHKEDLTLQEIGNRMDVSRERIRQVLLKAVQKIRGYLTANDFTLAIFLETHGNKYITLDQLKEKLSQENLYIISILIEGNDILHYYKPLDIFHCNINEVDTTFIDDYFEQLPETIRYYEYLPEFEDILELLGIKVASEALIEKLFNHYKIRRYGELCCRFRLYQLTALEYLFQYKLSEPIRCDEKGIDKLRELSKLYLNFEFEGSDRSIEARIRDSRNIILIDSLTFSWFSGEFDEALLGEIKIYMDRVIEQYGHVNATQLYEQFSDQLAVYNIKNKLHLYSIIRYYFEADYKIGQGNTLMIFKNEEAKGTINSLLIDYVKNAGGCIKKEFLMDEMKWPEYRVIQRIADINEIILWSRDEIRLVKTLNITEEQRNYIKDLLSKCMSSGFTSANILIEEMYFDSNIAKVFSQERELSDPVNLANYIKTLDVTIKGHANFLYNDRSPYKNIEEYLCQTLNQPTTRLRVKEILNKFGYSEQRYGMMINNLIESYKLVELSRDELISSDYFSLSAEEEQSVVDYLNHVIQDKHYMSLSNLTGYRRRLPIIDYQWTPQLLKSIAIKYGFKAINKIYSDWRYDPVIISTVDSHLRSYEDLVIYVIKHEYEGNMHMYNICDYLIQKGLLRIKEGKEKVFPYEIKTSQQLNIDELGVVTLR